MTCRCRHASMAEQLASSSGPLLVSVISMCPTENRQQAVVPPLSKIPTHVPSQNLWSTLHLPGLRLAFPMATA